MENKFNNENESNKMTDSKKISKFNDFNECKVKSFNFILLRIYVFMKILSCDYHYSFVVEKKKEKPMFLFPITQSERFWMKKERFYLILRILIYLKEKKHNMEYYFHTKLWKMNWKQKITFLKKLKKRK